MIHDEARTFAGYAQEKAAWQSCLLQGLGFRVCCRNLISKPPLYPKAPNPKPLNPVVEKGVQDKYLNPFRPEPSDFCSDPYFKEMGGCIPRAHLVETAQGELWGYSK